MTKIPVLLHQMGDVSDDAVARRTEEDKVRQATYRDVRRTDGRTSCQTDGQERTGVR